ncbi:MAG: hypothetical protein KF893_13310 [Caldilineaceae bacterium]|nr:hypothetical protein [Caldilineaceae bacterium]
MNLLFGAVQFHAAEEAGALARMAGAVARCAQIWQDGDVGLGYGASSPQTEGGLLHDPQRGLTLLASVRLINRRELAASLDLAPEAPHCADACLVLAAWQRWGIECVHHLEGDWHFALWDARVRRLVLARDHHGSSSFYYHHRADSFLFASTQKPLLAIPDLARRPDLTRMAQILSGALGDGSESGYLYIRRLPVAHTLTVDASGLRVERYWFPERLPTLHMNEAEAVETFLDLYRRAVAGRLAGAGKTGVMLSGGLDSGSAAALAAERLRQEGQTLYAFTAVPVAASSPELLRRGLVDEGPLAVAVAATAGNIHLTTVTARHISPLAGIRRMLEVHDEPAYPAGNSFWLRAIYETARFQSITTLLTGTAGNGTISWSGNPPDLLHTLWKSGPNECGQLWQQITARAGISPERALWTAAIKPLLRTLRDEVQGFLHRGSGPNWERYSPLLPAFTAQPEIRASIETGRERWQRWEAGERLVGPGRWMTPTFHFEDSVGFGLAVMDPTADRRVMEFCLALEPIHYHNGVESRRLIRQAMRGYLPDTVRSVRRRARQSADLVMRVHGQVDEITHTLTRLHRHPLAGEVIDLQRLGNLARHIGQQPERVSHYECNAVLLRGLMVALFLERFS